MTLGERQALKDRLFRIHRVSLRSAKRATVVLHVHGEGCNLFSQYNRLIWLEITESAIYCTLEKRCAMCRRYSAICGLSQFSVPIILRPGIHPC